MEIDVHHEIYSVSDLYKNLGIFDETINNDTYKWIEILPKYSLYRNSYRLNIRTWGSNYGPALQTVFFVVFWKMPEGSDTLFHILDHKYSDLLITHFAMTDEGKSLNEENTLRFFIKMRINKNYGVDRYIPIISLQKFGNYSIPINIRVVSENEVHNTCTHIVEMNKV